MFPKLHRDATDGDLDAVEDATEEEEATVLMPLAEGNTEAVTEEVDTPIPLDKDEETATGCSNIDLPPPPPKVELPP